jgi:hypothetical protein
MIIQRWKKGEKRWQKCFHKCGKNIVFGSNSITFNCDEKCGNTSFTHSQQHGITIWRNCGGSFSMYSGNDTNRRAEGAGTLLLISSFTMNDVGSIV